MWYFKLENKVNADFQKSCFRLTNKHLYSTSYLEFILDRVTKFKGNNKEIWNASLTWFFGTFKFARLYWASFRNCIKYKSKSDLNDSPLINAKEEIVRILMFHHWAVCIVCFLNELGLSSLVYLLGLEYLRCMHASYFGNSSNYIVTLITTLQ